jgi:hypothetical protein
MPASTKLAGILFFIQTCFISVTIVYLFGGLLNESCAAPYSEVSAEGLFFLSAITPMIVHCLLGQMTANNTGIRQSLLWSMRKWVRMIMYGFLQNIILFTGVNMLVVPGLIFAVWLMLMPIFVSVEDTSRSNPLQECRGMARGRFFKFAGYALVYWQVKTETRDLSPEPANQLE